MAGENENADANEEPTSPADIREAKQSAAKLAVAEYRVEQIERDLKKIDIQANTLSFSQIKQMFTWIGLPVVVATSVFGVSLWQTIQTETTSAAEQRAIETVATLTDEINVLQDRIQTLQSRSQETFEELRELRGRAEESARSVQRQADSAEVRATEATRALAALRQTAASAQEIQQALSGVEQIADQLAQNEEFRALVSRSALGGLSGMVAAFDQSEGCPIGWSNFQLAAGRTIIGVGQGEIDQIGDQDIPLTERRWRDFGGEESVVLSEAQMPLHSHSMSTSRNAGRNIHDGLAGSQEGYGIDQVFENPVGDSGSGFGELDRVLEVRGGSRPHNNMPPFVALFFCEKD